MSEQGHPYGNRPGDIYPPITERPYLYMVDCRPGTVELKVSTPRQTILRVELDYEEMAQFWETLSRALLHRIRQLS